MLPRSAVSFALVSIFVVACGGSGPTSDPVPQSEQKVQTELMKAGGYCGTVSVCCCEEGRDGVIRCNGHCTDEDLKTMGP